MKKKLLFTTLTLALLVGMNACKKDSNEPAATDETEITVTTDMARGEAVGENIDNDVFEIINIVGDENNLGKSTSSSGIVPDITTANFFPCATVTVTPQVGFPKTIVIDFGSGCTSPNGVTRSGKMIVTVSDSIRKPGTIVQTTFDSFYRNQYKREGIITWTNQSSPGIIQWNRKVENGKVISPTGNQWQITANNTITQTQGVQTPLIRADDVFEITGTKSITTPQNITRNIVITNALQKKFVCNWVDKGTKKITGPNHYVIIDFGNGTCDNIATKSVDGGTPVEITLP